MTEFAIVLPMLAMLLFGIIQFGILYNNYVTVTDAARAGARKAAVSRHTDPERRVRHGPHLRGDARPGAAGLLGLGLRADSTGRAPTSRSASRTPTRSSCSASPSSRGRSRRAQRSEWNESSSQRTRPSDGPDDALRRRTARHGGTRPRPRHLVPRAARPCRPSRTPPRSRAPRRSRRARARLRRSQRSTAAKNSGPSPGVAFSSGAGASAGQPNRITVSLEEPAPGFFAKVFGVNTVQIRARATARAGVMGSARYAAPIGVDEKHPLITGAGCGNPLPCFNQATELDLEKTGPGAFRLINIDGSHGGDEPGDPRRVDAQRLRRRHAAQLVLLRPGREVQLVEHPGRARARGSGRRCSSPSTPTHGGAERTSNTR